MGPPLRSGSKAGSTTPSSARAAGPPSLPAHSLGSTLASATAPIHAYRKSGIQAESYASSLTREMPEWHSSLATQAALAHRPAHRPTDQPAQRQASPASALWQGTAGRCPATGGGPAPPASTASVRGKCWALSSKPVPAHPNSKFMAAEHCRSLGGKSNRKVIFPHAWRLAHDVGRLLSAIASYTHLA